jgi:hypothetical protein
MKKMTVNDVERVQASLIKIQEEEDWPGTYATLKEAGKMLDDLASRIEDDPRILPLPDCLGFWWMGKLYEGEMIWELVEVHDSPITNPPMGKLSYSLDGFPGFMEPSEGQWILIDEPLW